MKPVLVFDLDDTLFPEHQFVISGFRAVDAWLAQEHALAGFGSVAIALFKRGLRGRIFDDALVQLGWTNKGIEIDTLVSIYREHEPSLSLHEDARWALERFRDSYQLAILTDGYLATQRRKVASLNVEPLVDTIVYSDEYGRDSWKPSPVPYRAVMERLCCRGDQCAYISDNPSKDFISAKTLDWTTIQILRQDGEYRDLTAEDDYAAHHEIQTLYELDPLLDHLK